MTTDTTPVEAPVHAGAHHLDGDLAPSPAFAALDAARWWASWTDWALRNWTDSPEGYVDTNRDTDNAEDSEKEQDLRLVSTSLIERGQAQCRLWTAIAAEERATKQAGIVAGALPPNVLVSRPPDDQLPFPLEVAEAAIRQLPVPEQT